MRDVFYHAQVFRVKDIRSSLIFLNGKIFTGSCFFHQIVFPAAGMGTCSTVGISARKIITEETPAGMCHTHSSMNKCLYLQILRNIVPDLLDFIQRKFSGRHYSFCPQAVPETIGGIIYIISLCTYVQFHVRCNFLCNLKYTRI